ncbi:group II intron reverse transcriptase/maturase [Gloeocapsa sp. PCC 73106]|uniref:group II intron reverse transcriptase/maturase n=1 Tax=Gloeocapsa sp. PCC 73106 TaxID=102232 RepID=UPI0002DB46A9|nr:group II intron reverse transcriptase/maturase [Gloeocapsa sp. PCC 73106]
MNVKYDTKNWNEIDWKTVEIAVFKLQKRIFRASQEGNVKRIHSLQKLLSTSYYGKLWAIRKVTQDNQGKKTAGVDGVKSLNPRERLEMVEKIKLEGKSKPTRRVWIPKPNGEKRPLEIPTIYERVKQCLVKLALEPEWESRFEVNSYGFRPGRSCHDAIEAIFNQIRYMPKYVLDADISKCFDKIDQRKLIVKINTYPQLRRQLKAWLKSGVIDEKSWYPTNEGTPQGGVVSPLLANIALHGMETEVKKYARTLKGNKRDNESSVSLIRYADDFVIIHKSLEVVLKCKEIIENWLKNIGLELKPSKTKISHTLIECEGNIGFDFLGFTIRQFSVGKHQSGKNSKREKLGFKTIIKPSKQKIKTHIKKLGEVIRAHKSIPQIALIKKLNPIIKGWSNYYSSVCSKEEFSYCDHILYQQLKRWAKRRHPKKSKTWAANKYWHIEGKRKWAFGVRNKESKNFFGLIEHNKTPIVEHVKVKSDASPFNGELTYWSSRRGKHPEVSTRVATLLKRQKGKCAHCGLIFRDEDLIEVDHITPKHKGGKNKYENLQLLHRYCHDIKTTMELKTCTDDNGFIREEPCEVKVSSTVLKTSRMGDRSA